MKNYFIRLPLKTAVIRPPTLDGLLSFAMFQKTRDLEQAHHALPLVKTQGIYHASSAILENLTGRIVVPFTGAMRLDDVPAKYIKGSGKWKSVRMRDCGNVMSTYEAQVASAIWYFFESEAPEEVRDLFNHIHFVGKAHQKGYGEIGQLELDIASVNGLLDAKGQPMRPVPINFEGVDTTAIRADVACRPSYWDYRNSEPCFVMAKNHFSEAEIERNYL